MKLTDEQIDAIHPIVKDFTHWKREFARAIEAELAKGQEPVAVMCRGTAYPIHPDSNFHDLPNDTKLYTSPQSCPKCAELQKSVDRLGEDWAKQHVQIVELESDRDEWKKRAEFSFTQRDKLEAEAEQNGKPLSEHQVIKQKVMSWMKQAKRGTCAKIAQRLQLDTDKVRRALTELKGEGCVTRNMVGYPVIWSIE